MFEKIDRILKKYSNYHVVFYCIIALFSFNCKHYKLVFTMNDENNCQNAVEQIRQLDFEIWDGLPVDCQLKELINLESIDVREYPIRHLGKKMVEVHSVLLDLPGYYRPTVNLRNGKVVMFDAMNPVMTGNLETLKAHLGKPALTLDWHYGTLPLEKGEWVFPDKGITLFLNSTFDKVLHIALYHATSSRDYLNKLRPNLKKTLLPRK